MLSFWQKALPFTSPRFVIKADQAPMLKDQLRQIKQMTESLRCARLVHALNQTYEEVEVMKQAFWLNIVNFMTLFRMAELALLKPQVLKNMNGYATWQTFWDSATIKITQQPFNISKILFTMLRQLQHIPSFSVIMPEKQSLTALETDIQNLVVREPSPFNFYGVFVPCKNFQGLQVFKVETLDK